MSNWRLIVWKKLKRAEIIGDICVWNSVIVCHVWVIVHVSCVCVCVSMVHARRVLVWVRRQTYVQKFLCVWGCVCVCESVCVDLYTCDQLRLGGISTQVCVALSTYLHTPQPSHTPSHCLSRKPYARGWHIFNLTKFLWCISCTRIFNSTKSLKVFFFTFAVDSN